MIGLQNVSRAFVTLGIVAIVLGAPGAAAAFDLDVSIVEASPLVENLASMLLCPPHDPILIDGNVNFDAAHGVTAGTGTLADPFIISGWGISSTEAIPIHVRNTDAPFVIQDVCIDTTGGEAFGIPPGIHLETVVDGVVQDSFVRHDGNGIFITGSQRVRVEGNNLLGTDMGFLSGDGVSTVDGSEVQVVSNEISEAGNYGIFFFGTDDASATGNLVTDSGTGGVGSNEGNNITIVNNDVVGTTGHLGLGGISVTQAVGVTIFGNLVEDTQGTGISVSTAHDVVVETNAARDNFDSGISLFRVTAGTVHGNTATGNGLSGLGGYGIGTFQGSDIALTHNWVDDNAEGIRISGPSSIPKDPFTLVRSTDDDISVAWNSITDHGALDATGITVFDADGVVIRHNLVARTGFDPPGDPAGQEAPPDAHTCPPPGSGPSGEAGFILVIAAAPIGLGTGIFLASSARHSQVDHNDLVDNDQQAFDGATSNQWDDGYPSGGNFWSDYPWLDQRSGAGQDVPSSPDGIGDVPREVDGHPDNPAICDMYPLMGAGNGPQWQVISAALPVNLVADAGLARKAYEASGGAVNGVTGFVFPVDPATVGTKFLLAMDSLPGLPAEGPDVQFFDALGDVLPCNGTFDLGPMETGIVCGQWGVITAPPGGSVDYRAGIPLTVGDVALAADGLVQTVMNAGSSDVVTFSAPLSNEGFRVLTDVEAALFVDGTMIRGAIQPCVVPGDLAENISFDWETRGVPNGAHEVAIVLDPRGLVSEVSEANNVLTTILYVQGNKVENPSEVPAAPSSDHWGPGGVGH